MPCGGNSFRNCLRLEKFLLCLPNLFRPVLVSFPSKHQKQPKDDFVKSVAGHPVFSIDTKNPLCNGPAKELWQSWIVFQHWSKIFKQISFLSYDNILHVWIWHPSNFLIVSDKMCFAAGLMLIWFSPIFVNKWFIWHFVFNNLVWANHVKPMTWYHSML